MIGGETARRTLRATLAFGAVFAFVSGAPAAGAETDGPCAASFNGIESERIDSLDSPLELDADDILTFHGTDTTGTQNARVEMVLAMVTVRDGTATYGPLQNDFSASLDLADVSPYGVGLYRVRGVTDNCSIEAWVRISGRFPFATLTGLTAGGLALGGFAAQMTAIATRRRHSAWVAAIAGMVTGVGIAGIGQQLGRMQLSIPSILIVAGITAVLGAVVAILLNPGEGTGWLARRRTSRAQKRAIRYQARLEAARLDADRRETEAAQDDAVAEAAESAASASVAAPASTRTPIPIPTRSTGETASPVTAATPDPKASPAPDPAPAVAAPQPAPQPASIEGPAWCYVLAAVDVFDLADHTRTVGTLQPGNWYLSKRRVGGWAQVVVGDGIEGWAAQSAIHHHG